MTDSLIQKLRDATSGTRELDAEIYAWREGVEFVSYSTCRHSGREIVKLKQRDMDVRLRLPEVVISRFTTSLDAIIGLIEEKLPGWSWSLDSGTPSHSIDPYMTLNGSNLALLSALEGET